MSLLPDALIRFSVEPLETPFTAATWSAVVVLSKVRVTPSARLTVSIPVNVLPTTLALSAATMVSLVPSALTVRRLAISAASRVRVTPAAARRRRGR